MKFPNQPPTARGDRTVTMNKAAAALLILCLLSATAVHGQEAVDPPPAADAAAPVVPAGVKALTRYKSNFFRDEAEMWTKPLHLDGRGLLLCGTVLAATGFLVANDEGIYSNFKTFQGNHPWVDKVSPAVTMLGDWGVDCGIAGLFFLGGVIARDRKARDTGLMAWEALLHTGILCQVVKHLAGRQRPWVENGIDHWYGPSAFFKRYSQDFFSRYDSFFPGIPSRPGAWPR